MHTHTTHEGCLSDWLRSRPQHWHVCTAAPGGVMGRCCCARWLMGCLSSSAPNFGLWLGEALELGASKQQAPDGLSSYLRSLRDRKEEIVKTRNTNSNHSGWGRR